MRINPRVATAVVLVPLMLGAIFGLPTEGFALVMALLLGGGAWEWSRLSGWRALPARLGYVLLLLLLVTMAWRTMAEPNWLGIALGGALIWWSAALAWVVWFPFSPASPRIGPWLKGVAGILALVPAWMALVVLHGSLDFGPAWLMSLLALVWVADSGAYFAGRRWGRRKLSPRVSPGKTREGVYGAMVLVMVYALAAGWALGIAPARLLYFVVLCLALVPVSVLGDLFESMLKRQQGIKDSGRLLPGHGGVLDRIDSITSAAPLFLLGLLWLNIPA